MKKTTKQKVEPALNIVRKYFRGVESVVDGHKRIEIEVTKRDNDESTPLAHDVCAFAVACKRSLQADAVLVGMRTAYVVYGKKAVRYRLLESTAREIVSFDRKAGFYTGRYPLLPPSESERLGHYHKGTNNNQTGRKIRPMRHITANTRTILGRGEPKGAA